MGGRKGGLVRLVLAVAGWLVAAVALPLALGRAFNALFAAWNVNADTVARAPGWARMVYRWHGSFITLLSAALVVGLCARLFRVRVEKPGRTAGLWWLVGTGAAVLSALLFLATDSLRLRWPIGRPNITPGLLVLWLLNLVSAFAEELFTKAALYDTVKARWGRVAATAAATVVFFLMGGGLSGTVVSGVNVALMGVACCLLYDRFGLWAPVMLRWGWGFATVFLLGHGGGDHAVYRLYAISESWLTGGDPGFAYGLWLTILLVLLCATALWNRKNTGD